MAATPVGETRPGDRTRRIGRLIRPRRAGGARKLDPTTAEQARRDHFAFAITRHEVEPFADRIWDLRSRYPSHDSCHLALAEALAGQVVAGWTHFSTTTPAG